MMQDSIDFLVGRDPLGRDIPVTQTLDVAVLGVPVRFESNSERAIEVAIEAFGVTPPAIAGVWGRRPLVVRLIVHAGDASSDADAGRVRCWAPDKARVLLQGKDTVGIADAGRGQAVAYVSEAVVAQRAHFRYAVVEALTLVLVVHHDRHPMHAAAVGRDGAAILLSAPSGIGKSTLAYAAHLAGLTVMSDDIAWVQLHPRMRVWGGGRSRRVHLLPDARDRFAGLASADAIALPNGKRKIPVEVGDAMPGEPMSAERVTVCLLERTTGATLLSRASPDAIRAALTTQPDPGFDRYPARLRACARALAANGGWRLAVSNDPASAVPPLLSMLDGIVSL